MLWSSSDKSLFVNPVEYGEWGEQLPENSEGTVEEERRQRRGGQQGMQGQCMQRRDWGGGRPLHEEEEGESEKQRIRYLFEG